MIYQLYQLRPDNSCAYHLPGLYHTSQGSGEAMRGWTPESYRKSRNCDVRLNRACVYVESDWDHFEDAADDGKARHRRETSDDRLRVGWLWEGLCES